MKDILRLRTTVSRIPVITELRADDRYYVIFVCVRYTQLDSVTASLNANSSPALVLSETMCAPVTMHPSFPERRYSLPSQFPQDTGRRTGSWALT